MDLHAIAAQGWVHTAGVVSCSLGALSILVGWWKSRLVSAIEDTPTSWIGDIQEPGYHEVVGVIGCDEPIRHPEGTSPVVWFRFRVVEDWEETTAEDGAKRQENWQEVQEEEVGSTRFYVRDRSGRILVDPEGIDADAEVVSSRQVGGEDSAQASLGDSAWAAKRRKLGTRRELAGFCPDQKVYLIGPVERVDGELVFTGREGEGPFRISAYSEESQLEGMADVGPYLYATGILLLLVGGMALKLNMGS